MTSTRVRFAVTGFVISTISAMMVSFLAAPGIFAQRPTVQARAVRPVSVTGDLVDITRANDDRDTTRATSGKSDYTGMQVILDLGGDHNIVGVNQGHGRWPVHYPGRYRVEIGTTEQGPWMEVFEGPGNRGESKALFDAVRGRFIRITATATGGVGDWSISRISAVVDPGARPKIIPPRESPRERPESRRGSVVAGDLNDLRFAMDRDMNTRAASGRPNYSGMSLTLDLGGEYEFSRIVQMHGQWADDYPAEYKVEASRRRDESAFREVWRGPGSPTRSIASFNPIITRYVRITALKNRSRFNWWSIAEVRTDRDADVIDDDDDDRLDRPIQRAVAPGLTKISAAIDDNRDTRATTGKANYAGTAIVLDLGGSYTISRVIQVHDPYDGDHPGRYRIEVSADRVRWQTVWEGEGTANRSRAMFDPVRARYVRITATAVRNNRNWWSISTLRVRG